MRCNRTVTCFETLRPGIILYNSEHSKKYQLMCVSLLSFLLQVSSEAYGGFILQKFGLKLRMHASIDNECTYARVIC